MEPKQLTLEELAVVHDKNEIPYFEIIKGMSLSELRSFDCYKPSNLKHYVEKQQEWLEEEAYLIGKRLGHNRKVSNEDLLADFEKHHNGERLRVWYVLRFPGLVENTNYIK
jgi:hypothetical protein